MKRLAAIATLALASACTASSARENVVLVAPSEGAQLIRQCSRSAPDTADAFFTPSPREITAIETAAMSALLAARDDHAEFRRNMEERGIVTPFDWPDDPSAYQRQYVGYVADGRRMIYGNYLPASGSDGNSAEPLIVCDGGPVFFGVEFDLETGNVMRIAFNGGLGGPMLGSIEP